MLVQLISVGKIESTDWALFVSNTYVVTIIFKHVLSVIQLSTVLSACIIQFMSGGRLSVFISLGRSNV